MIKKFITQQPSNIPEELRNPPVVYTKKVPKKRGRKKFPLSIKHFLWSQRIEGYKMSGLPYTREGFAAALGLDPKMVNTIVSAFLETPEEQDQLNRETQAAVDKSFCKPRNLTAVPILEQEDILRRDFSLKQSLRKLHAVTIAKEPRFGDRLHYFAFIMPDNCMLMDGVCKGDKIVAASNLRPSHGDLVVCRIPGLQLISVRRYSGTCNPALYDLYEGGSTNPVLVQAGEKRIYGVVVGLERNYWPGRLPEE